MANIKIYTKDYCPFCIKAKMLFKKLGVDFEEINVNDEIMNVLIEKTGMMTVPQIFIDDKLIGGCDDLYELEREGTLKELLKK
jgi:glutaredoxin 3